MFVLAFNHVQTWIAARATHGTSRPRRQARKASITVPHKRGIGQDGALFTVILLVMRSDHIRRVLQRRAGRTFDALRGPCFVAECTSRARLAARSADRRLVLTCLAWCAHAVVRGAPDERRRKGGRRAKALAGRARGVGHIATAPGGRVRARIGEIERPCATRDHAVSGRVVMYAISNGRLGSHTGVRTTDEILVEDILAGKGAAYAILKRTRWANIKYERR